MLLLLFIVRLSMGYQFQSVASVSTVLVHEFGFSYAQVGTLVGFFCCRVSLSPFPSA
jgi:hypothetical protein